MFTQYFLKLISRNTPDETKSLSQKLITANKIKLGSTECLLILLWGKKSRMAIIFSARHI